MAVLFLMHRVELKDNPRVSLRRLGSEMAVPNAPCGVESPQGVGEAGEGFFYLFLMHRVELKVLCCSWFHGLLRLCS